MLIEICVLAKDEEASIARTLASLLCQTVFRSPHRIAVHVVANGCQDKTVEYAHQFLARKEHESRLEFHIHDFPEPGKSRAWNQFVHNIMASSADYVVFTDGDIEFSEANNNIELAIHELENNPTILICSGKPEKRILPSGLVGRAFGALSQLVSRAKDTSTAIAGSFYVARSHQIRAIWLPVPLPVEDGFLHAMVQTDGFTSVRHEPKIRQLPNIVHYYEQNPSPTAYFHHEKRIIVGSVINSWIYTVLWERGATGHTGGFIRDQNENDPAWIEKLISKNVAGRAWVIPSTFMFWRLRGYQNSSWLKRISRLPIALSATALSFIPCIMANRALRRQGSSSIW